MTRRAAITIPTLVPLLRGEDSSASRAHQIMVDWRTAQKAPGLSAAVWKGGSIIWSESLGVSDVEDAAPVSSRTRFRIGSVSKILTAAAAARLFDQGLLDLDVPIQQYVPAFPVKSGNITARLLLGHLSGLRH